MEYAFSEDEFEDGPAFDYAPEEGEEEGEDWEEGVDMDEDEEWGEEVRGKAVLSQAVENVAVAWVTLQSVQE
jgi:hypothetical protein